MTDLKPGAIVQIGPDHKWAFCLAVVDEVKPCGVQVYIRIPDNDAPGDAYIRLSRDDFEAVGASAIWGPA